MNKGEGKRKCKGCVEEKQAALYGGRYVGEWKDGKCHGHGIYKFENGDTYEGEWENDKRHGHGIMTYADGSVYDGDWIDDMHGNGE
jgi:hypothetical protein